jgi:hypothetical protein
MRFRKFFILTFFLLAFLQKSFFLHAEIFEVDRIEKILPYIHKEMLVIFDLDNTLIQTSQDLGSDQWFSHRMEECQKKTDRSEKEQEKLIQDYSAILNMVSFKLVEKSFIDVLTTLQKKQLTLMAQTARGMAFYWITQKHLQSVGIDLSKKTPYEKDFYFRNQKEIFWQKGILFSNGTDKGQTLFEFFDFIGYKPKAICFIDDKLTPLNKVQKECDKRKIPFIGLRYSYLDSKVKSYSPHVADGKWSRIKSILFQPSSQELYLESSDDSSSQTFIK